MRHRIVGLLALAILASPSCGDNDSAELRRPAAVLTATLEGGVCTLRWNGALVSRRELLQNSANLLIEALERQAEKQCREEERGEYHEYDGPIPVDLRLEAARGLPFSCFGEALRLPQLAGFSEVTLRIAGEQLPDQKVFFELEPHERRPRFSAIVQLARNGRMTWNSEAIDLNGLRERVRAMDTHRPDDVAVAPTDEADFVTFYEVVRAVGRIKATPTMVVCAGLPGDSRALY